MCHVFFGGDGEVAVASSTILTEPTSLALINLSINYSKNRSFTLKWSKPIKLLLLAADRCINESVVNNDCCAVNTL